MAFKLSQRSVNELSGVHKDLVALCFRAIQITKIDFAIVQGVRTQEYQDNLYALGRTNLGKIVTWTKKSRHIGGFAIDFAAFVSGKIDWDPKYYPLIAQAFMTASLEKNIPIVWGGTWKNKDWGHIELNKDFYPDKVAE